MRFKYETKVYDDINITPMLDLAWNLLVIFILMATGAVQGLSVDLPRASAAPSLAHARTKAVTITADGQVYLDTVNVTLPELESTLRTLKAEDPDLPVVVKGDASIQYQRVVEVLDIIKRVHIAEVGLATQRLVR